MTALGIAIGDPFSVNFTVDPTTVTDLNPTSSSGLYSFPSSPLTANIAGHPYSSTGLFVVVGNNAASVPPVDFVTVQGAGSFAGNVIAPYQILGLTVGLTSSNTNLISSDAFFMPTDVSPFDQNRSFALSLQSSSPFNIVTITGLIANTAASPEDQIEDLISQIASLNLGFGTTTSLNTKLGQAVLSLSRGNGKSTCNIIDAFRNEVEALSGGQLTIQQAGDLENEAAQLLTSIGCS
jgi:hypothetical protein